MADARPLPAWADELRRRYLRGESAIFHASACSRPPEPMRRIFMLRGFAGVGRRVNHAGL